MKFIADSMLGRLAKWLRLFGYDTVYFKGKADSELIYESIKQQRIILTRDAKISKNRPLKIVFIKSENFKDQVRQAAEELGIKFDGKCRFTRCVECNRELAAISKEKVKNAVPCYIYDTCSKFSFCPGCKKIYWEGSHLKLASELIKTL